LKIQQTMAQKHINLIANVELQQIMAESYKQWANNGWKHREWLMRGANEHHTATNNGQTYKRWANNGHNATNNGKNVFFLEI